ncbi:MAG TPA: trypsin-like peptidase domain-containing protein [Anaerolineales bacterium]
MNTNNPLHNRLLISVVVLLIASLACGNAPVEVVPPTATATLAPPTATPLPTSTPLPTPKPIPTISELTQATVQVLAMFGEDIEWWGSGTIISSDGLILTNAHVAHPQASGLALFYDDLSLAFSPLPDQLAIAVVDDESKPPEQKYIAEVVSSDGVLDLAVLRIVSDMDGEPINPKELQLSFVEVGDSDTVHLGESIRIFGFPGIGGETITFTQGTVSGFESQDNVGDKAFIKTDTEIAGGNSGGLAVNEAGQIIGVPTLTVSSDSGSVIGRLRSINLAKPMLEAAVAGKKYVSEFAEEGTGNENFTLTTWAEDYDDNQCPVEPLERYPSGALSIVSSWSYQDMAEGEDFIVLYYHNRDFIYYEFFAWDEGSSADCYVLFLNYGGSAMPEGDYRVEVYAGKGYPLISSADTVVGPVKSGDIKIKGWVFDNLTGDGILDANFIVLNPGVDLDAWLDNPTEADIFSAAATDANGRFTLSDTLERLVEYPVLVFVDGYNLASGFLRYGQTDPAQDEITVYLDPR